MKKRTVQRGEEEKRHNVEPMKGNTGVDTEEERERRVGKQGWLEEEVCRKNKDEDEKKELEMKEEMEDLERFEENERMGVEVRNVQDGQKREGVERR